MNFPLSLEKKINKFGQKAKIFEKNENAHEIRKKQPFYVRACYGKWIYKTWKPNIADVNSFDACMLPNSDFWVPYPAEKFDQKERLTIQFLENIFFEIYLI